MLGYGYVVRYVKCIVEVRDNALLGGLKNFVVITGIRSVSGSSLYLTDYLGEE